MILTSYENLFLQTIKNSLCKYEVDLFKHQDGGLTRYAHLTPAGEARFRVFFVHGTGNDLFFPQLSLYQRILSLGGEVFCFDLPGHGTQSQSYFGTEQNSSHIHEIYQWWKVKESEHDVLMGHSLGGALLVRLIEEHALQNIQVIMITTPCRVRPLIHGINELCSPFKQSFRDQKTWYGWWGALPALGPFKRQQYPIRLFRTEQSYLNLVDQELRQIAGRDGELSCRMWAICGSEDRMAPLEDAEVYCQRATQAEIIQIPGENHYTTLFADATLQQLEGVFDELQN